MYLVRFVERLRYGRLPIPPTDDFDSDKDADGMAEDDDFDPDTGGMDEDTARDDKTDES